MLLCFITIPEKFICQIPQVSKRGNGWVRCPEYVRQSLSSTKNDIGHHLFQFKKYISPVERKEEKKKKKESSLKFSNNILALFSSSPVVHLFT